MTKGFVFCVAGFCMVSDPIDFILNRGQVDKLVTENNTFVGDWRK